MKRLAVKFDGNEILSIDDFDVFRDLWKTDSEKRNAVTQGIIHSGGCTLDCMKLKMLRIRAIHPLKLKLLPTHIGASSLFLSTLKC